MKRTIQVRISKGDLQFVAECLALPVVTQAPTLDELAFNQTRAIAVPSTPYFVRRPDSFRRQSSVPNFSPSEAVVLVPALRYLTAQIHIGIGTRIEISSER